MYVFGSRRRDIVVLLLLAALILAGAWRLRVYHRAEAPPARGARG